MFSIPRTYFIIHIQFLLLLSSRVELSIASKFFRCREGPLFEISRGWIEINTPASVDPGRVDSPVSVDSGEADSAVFVDSKDVHPPAFVVTLKDSEFKNLNQDWKNQEDRKINQEITTTNKQEADLNQLVLPMVLTAPKQMAEEQVVVVDVDNWNLDYILKKNVIPGNLREKIKDKRRQTLTIQWRIYYMPTVKGVMELRSQ